MDSKALTVSDDLSIVTYPTGTGLTLMSREGTTEGLVFVNWEELPALLDRLNAAAEEMGVVTGQGELVKALRGLMVSFMEHIGPGEPMSNDDAKAIAAAQQAIAKAE